MQVLILFLTLMTITQGLMRSQKPMAIEIRPI